MKFENQTFTTDVTLDYNEFVNCTFKKCIIHFGGGQYTLTECKFDGGAFFAFHDGALRTLSVLKLMSSVSGGLDVVRQIVEKTPSPPPMKLN